LEFTPKTIREAPFMKKPIICLAILLFLLAGCNSTASAPKATTAATPDMLTITDVDPDGYLLDDSVWETTKSDVVNARWTKEDVSEYEAYSMSGKTFCGLDGSVTFLYEADNLKSYNYSAKVFDFNKDQILKNFDAAYTLLKDNYGSPECTEYDKRTYTNPKSTYSEMQKDVGVTGDSFYYNFVFETNAGQVTLSLQGENIDERTGNYGINVAA